MPMGGKSSSRANWGHRKCGGGARRQLAEREGRGQCHSPTWVSPGSPHKQEPGQARQIPRDPSNRKAGLKKGETEGNQLIHRERLQRGHIQMKQVIHSASTLHSSSEGQQPPELPFCSQNRARSSQKAGKTRSPRPQTSV